MLTQKQLTNLGLSEKEAAVYLAILELGPSTVSEIASLSRINRTTGYDILESLTSYGLVSHLGKGKIVKYIAEDPEKIIHFTENQIKDAKERLEMARELLPELKSIHRKKEKPMVKFYEGKEGMVQAFEDTLTSKETIVGYACGEPMFRVLPDWWQDYIKRRVAKNIHTKGILPDTIRVKEIAKHDKEQLRESRLVPEKLFDLTIEINIYDNKVLIASWEENLAIIIESEKIAKAQKRIFDLAWRGAKELEVSKNKITVPKGA